MNKEGGKEESLVISGGRTFWQSNSQCKGQEEEVCLTCSRPRKEAKESGGKWREWEVRKKRRHQSRDELEKYGLGQMDKSGVNPITSRDLPF